MHNIKAVLLSLNLYIIFHNQAKIS